MIETLSELVKTASVERMNLSIQNSGEMRVAISIQCIFGAEQAEASESQRDLRRALSKPILVEGLAGEVDTKIDSLLTRYVNAIRPHILSLKTNIDDTVEGVTQAANNKAEHCDDSNDCRNESNTKLDLSASNDLKLNDANTFAIGQADSL